MSTTHGEQRTSAKVKLAVGAIGIVFGDIGTSPLYAFRETFVGPHPLAIDDLHIFGVISLIFWSMTLVVSIQYVGILMSADNKGEGGTLALVALLSRKIGNTGYAWITVMLAVFATALFYGWGWNLATPGAAACLGFSLAIFAVQIVVAQLWLRRYRFGPLEWVWRSVVYWKRQPMRN